MPILFRLASDFCSHESNCALAPRGGKVSARPVGEGGAVNDIALPGEVTTTGLVLPESLSFEDWDAIGKRLSQVASGVQWWIGDWLNYGERRYGEMYAQAEVITERENQTLRNYKWVSANVEMSVRTDNLSWNHHLQVAALPPETQRDLLARADAESWTSRDTKKAARRSKVQHRRISRGVVA